MACRLHMLKPQLPLPRRHGPRWRLTLAATSSSTQARAQCIPPRQQHSTLRACSSSSWRRRPRRPMPGRAVGARGGGPLHGAAC